jgi:hypothetical protein
MNQVGVYRNMPANPLVPRFQFDIWNHSKNLILEPQAEYSTGIGAGKLTAFLAGCTFEEIMKEIVWHKRLPVMNF